MANEIMGPKRSTGSRYKGLRNQGATCYLNSVLQCLYMTEDFREEVEKFSPDSSNIHLESSQSNDLMRELKDLFKKIKEADGTTKGITQSLHISNVHVQEDAVEYYQKILKAANPQASKIFEGVLLTNTACLKNHTFREKHKSFTIPLSIDTGHSRMFDTVSGLQMFFDVVKLDEDNWLYCKDCGKKTETQTWTDIEVFPTILTLYMKRFYFDYNQMRPVKNDCSMYISPKLDINNIGYSLYAVINHSGNERGGHYNVFIKSFEDGEWYLFDDSFVTQVSANFLHHGSDKAILLMYKKLHSDEKSTNEPCCAPNQVTVKGDEHLSYVASLKEHWNDVSGQVNSWLKNADELAKYMQDYRQLYDFLIQWIARAKKRQNNIEAKPVSGYKALQEQLHQSKKLLEEIKNKEDKVNECKRYASAYMNLIKNHERQLTIWTAALGRNRMVTDSYSIVEEINKLDKLYTEVLTLPHHYIKLKTVNHQEDNEEELTEHRHLSNEEIKHKHQQVQEPPQSQNKIEENSMIQSQMKTTTKQNMVADAEEDTAEEVDKETNKICDAEEKLKQKSETEQEVVMQTHMDKDVCKTFKYQMEENKTKILAEDAKQEKESTTKCSTNVQQYTDGREHYNQATAAEAARHAQVLEHTAKLRNIPKTESKNVVYTSNAVAMHVNFSKVQTESQTGDATKFNDPTPDPEVSLYRQTVKKYKFDQEKTEDQATGSISVEDISKGLQIYLHRNYHIAGIYVVDTQEKLSIYQAMKKNYIEQDFAIALLKAQAATGYVIDPCKNQILTVSDAVEMEVVGREFKDMLLFAEQAVTGYTDPDTDMVLSLFQAMKKGLIDEKQGIYLLEAQLATGGIIDPIASHRVPVKVACELGLFDDEMNHILNGPKTKCFFDRNLKKDLIYSQLLEQCTIDAETGFALFLI